MKLMHLEQAALGVAVMALTQIPQVSQDPAAQRLIESQLTAAASVRLDPNARVSSLNLTARPLREILDAIAQAGQITLRYASDVTNLDRSATLAVTEKTVEEALRAALGGHELTFQAMGSKIAFIYPNTPAHREKYTASIRVFPIVKADLPQLTTQLNRTLKPTADGFRPMILTVADPRALVVRAIPELMRGIAAWIAENDKDQSTRD